MDSAYLESKANFPPSKTYLSPAPLIHRGELEIYSPVERAKKRGTVIIVKGWNCYDSMPFYMFF